jgi:hypothetical protein
MNMLSIEEAAAWPVTVSFLRSASFERSGVVVGHTADDQVET